MHASNLFNLRRFSVQCASLMLLLILGLPGHSQAEAKAVQLILFVQPACPWCDKLEKDLAENPAFVRYLDATFTQETVDIRSKEPLPAFKQQSGKQIAKEHRVRITPTTVLIYGGETIGRIPGYIEPKDYQSVIHLFLQEAGLEAKAGG
ncbi:thioredoxin fold domain-containing protein [Magnetococcus sp. PR-3]|uniref:thioredoxin fold domain-containing protein n=1 Tax=Magnetococcus sp. PR-3 TaxID=3120355 RepID=UPI002FCE2958